MRFSGIENLTGGTGGDTFVMAKGKGISGKLKRWWWHPNRRAGLFRIQHCGECQSDHRCGYKHLSVAPLAGVTGISDVFGGSASDTLIGNASDNFLFGNGGNDTLDGMAGNNVLVGGSGNDTLTVTGSTGRNLLLAGNGADHLTGGTGNDILFNGTTSFDADVATLNTIYTFWKNAANFATAVSQLRAGTATGVTIALDPSNVFSDAFTDIMTGGGGSNWFFAKVNSPAMDNITDLTGTDAVN